jgi:hypothetical protein
MIVAAVTVIGSATPVSAAPCPGCLNVSAPTIGLSVTARPGGSEVIDQVGGVAVYTPLTTGAAGGMGTVWLAGHRTTRGSVFNRVPSLLPGDPIDLIDDAGTHRYIVSRLLIVPANGWQSQVDIHDMSRSRVILQTSHPDSGLRYLIEAFGSTPQPCRNKQLVVGNANLSAATTRFVAIAPQRILDTRSDGAGAVCADGNIELQIAGIPGVAADATAVALTVTATGNAGPGFISVGPAGVDPGVTSSVNLTAAGQSRANLVMVAIGMSGRIAVHSSVATHLIVDVAGYFVPSTSARDGRFVEVTPARLLDTRSDQTQRRLRANEAITVNVAARAHVPATEIGAVLVNLTAVNGATQGYITAWAAGTPQPTTSNLNLSTVGDVAANLAIVPLGADGAIQLVSSTDLDVIVDIVGYFTNANAPVKTSGLFVPLLPQRVLDTRTSRPALSAGSTSRIDLLGPTAIRTTATLVANLTSTDSRGSGFLSITGGSAPSTSNLNVANGETRANLAVVSVRVAEPTHLYTSLATHLIIDVTGYFTASGREQLRFGTVRLVM